MRSLFRKMTGAVFIVFLFQSLLGGFSLGAVTADERITTMDEFITESRILPDEVAIGGIGSIGELSELVNYINAEVVTSNTTWDFARIGRDVYVGPNAILFINGDVEIYGNLYILGAVVSYGDLTVDGIYAHSAFYGYSSTVYQGSMNYRAGSHSVSRTVVSNQPIPNIPIEIYSNNIVNEDEVLPLLEGATLPIGDLYLDGISVDYNENGTFAIRDYYVGSRTSIEFKVVDVFGKQHIYTYDLNNLNQVDSIMIESLPTKLVYYVGETLDVSGLMVEATYLNGKKNSMEVDESAITGFDSSKPQMGQVLTVTVDGKSVDFTVDIIADPITGLEITKLPEKIQYVEGQALDLTGLEVTAAYTSGKSSVIEISEEHVSGFDSAIATDRQTLTVTVEEATAQFDIRNIERILTSVKLEAYPEKTTYYVGEIFSLEGLILHGTYNDDSTEVLNHDRVHVDGFDSSVPVNEQTVILSVGEWNFEVIVDIVPEPALQILAGETRYSTATAISQASYSSADTVILVQANNFPDALAAGPLAYMMDAPILLTGTARLSSTAKLEMERLEAKKIIIMGGFSAVSENVENTLRAEGYTVERLEGSNRYATAVATAQYMEVRLGRRNTVVLASGNQFADALAAGSYAAKEGHPILLTDGNRMTKTTMDYITQSGVSDIIVVGGTSVISEALEAELEDMGITITRKSGKNRFDTSLEIAKSYFENAEMAIVANGMEFADALAAAPYAARMNAPILLVNRDRINLPIKEYLPDSEIYKIIVVGGDAAVNEAVRNELIDLIG